MRAAPLIVLLSLCALPLQAQRHLDRYDDTFRKYSKRFFGVAYDWRRFKAQGITESNLNPGATSWVGARGIMQLMPSTFQAIQSRNPLFTSIDDVEWNIAAGVMHDRELWRLDIRKTPNYTREPVGEFTRRQLAELIADGADWLAYAGEDG